MDIYVRSSELAKSSKLMRNAGFKLSELCQTAQVPPLVEEKSSLWCPAVTGKDSACEGLWAASVFFFFSDSISRTEACVGHLREVSTASTMWRTWAARRLSAEAGSALRSFRKSWSLSRNELTNEDCRDVEVT